MHSTVFIAEVIAAARVRDSASRSQSAPSNAPAAAIAHREPARVRHAGNHLAPARVETTMSVKVYGINHIAIEVDDIEKAVAFYQDVFDLEKLDEGEGDAFFKVGEHQFLAMFEVEKAHPSRTRHFGFIVRDEAQLARSARETDDASMESSCIPPFRCDFVDPFGNRVQVVDLHDESLVWLLPYQEVQEAGIVFK